MKFTGQILKSPRLRFNASLTYSTSHKPLDLRRFGPYDSTLFPLDKIRCKIIYLKNYEDVKDLIIEGLTRGIGIFDGYQKWFRVNITFDAKEISSESSDELTRAAREVSTGNAEFVFVILSGRNPENYRICKTILLGNGIPNQIITSISKLRDPEQRPWIISNIALSTYAKVGGTPWIVEGGVTRKELVIGVSRAQDVTRRYIIGFVTLYTQNGDFLLLHSQAPVIRWEEYVDGLRNLIVDAFRDYEKIRGIPNAIILHFHKKPGKPELNAIEDALKEVGQDIPYALVHLNEYSNYRLFDSSHSSYVPQTGLAVRLSGRQAILLLDGRADGPRRRIGVPRVLEVTLDKRSSIGVEEFPILLQQVYNFSYVNWRGFNAKSIPMTINYSYLISRLVAEIGVNNWNSIISSGKLRDKAWFL